MGHITTRNGRMTTQLLVTDVAQERAETNVNFEICKGTLQRGKRIGSQPVKWQNLWTEVGRKFSERATSSPMTIEVSEFAEPRL